QEDPYAHLVKVEKSAGAADTYAFDETYPYLDDSFRFKWNSWVNALAKWLLVSPWNRIKYGLRIKGKEVLKPYKEQLKGGAVCICNHVYIFDALSVCRAVRWFRRMWIPMYAKHFNGIFGWVLRYMGGIPVAETVAGMRKFNEAFDEFHRRGDWILVFPEEVRWNYYKPIRPFRKGAFTMAYKYNVPIIPFVITYRERKGLYKLFGKPSEPLMTLTVGEPLLPDRTHTRKEEVDGMRLKLHAQMEKMAGIQNNPWPAIPCSE
ncbi:MAG: 1-acyl-sn-glycerol-3-phosphate acyltransferase, partial [Bacteroidales bacterium]|nr:1-acyl-sn-glycerol-3-phosphate acyltransferase [Bacteroidales bacterium]